MANQPPARPWFRLPAMGRQTAAPAPAPQPQPQPQQPPAPQQPRVPIIRPAFRPAFTQAQSAPPPPPPPPSSAPPAQPPSAASPPPYPIGSPSPPPSRLATAPSTPPFVASPPSPMPAMTGARSLGVQPQQPSSVRSPSTYSLSPNNSQLPTPTASPKVVDQRLDQPQSPIKTTRSPPPISLPPSQFNSSKGEAEPKSLPEAEQEKVLLQETFNKKVVFPTADQGNSHKGFGHNASSKYGRRKGGDGRKSSSDSDDGKNVRIITMTGENKGALMELDLPSRRDRHGNRGKPLENSSAGNDSGESEGFDGGNADRSNKKDRKRMEAQSRLPMSGYVNSNVQGINNSILYNCSFTHHDPGVHFSVSRKPLHGKEQGNGGHEIYQNHHPNGKQL